MAKHKLHTVPYRRKRKGKTNYKKRLFLLKSGKPRLVVRRTNKYLIIQLVEYKPDGDKVLNALTSRALKKMGWKCSCNNIPAAYLTGYVFGKGAKVKEAVLDLGLQTPVAGARLYAALKGVNEHMKVRVSEKVYPKDDRISGEHIAAYAEKAKDKFKYDTKHIKEGMEKIKKA